MWKNVANYTCVQYKGNKFMILIFYFAENFQGFRQINVGIAFS